MDSKIKDIKGFEGLYAITDDGRVWSYPKRGGTKNGKWLKFFIDNGGYKNYVFSRKTKRTSHKCHRLIAKAFIPNPNNLPEINHKNCNKLDNRIPNLEWCSKLDNMRHAYKNKLIPIIFGKRHGMSKMDNDKIIEIRKRYDTGLFSQRKLASMFGLAQSSIGSILRKETWIRV
jgi:hypothetical protein